MSTKVLTKKTGQLAPSRGAIEGLPKGEIQLPYCDTKNTIPYTETTEADPFFEIFPLFRFGEYKRVQETLIHLTKKKFFPFSSSPSSFSHLELFRG